eukprot:TRINITY_DN642_c0_g1_i1.p1 TRINITY_DN642_c0_g1~~TRINITY_DN642_c0_g1_i1.p1  ORF type:complete len:165 (+),score=21.74 TRINITY_DN642_c0_g1_i1:105-599(+)
MEIKRDLKYKAQTWTLDSWAEGETTIGKIEFAFFNYSNRIVIFLTQFDKIATLVSAKSEASVEQEEEFANLYEVTTIFGEREHPLYEVIARGIVGLLNNEREVRDTLEKTGLPFSPTFLNPFKGKEIQFGFALHRYTSDSINRIVHKRILDSFRAELCLSLIHI